MGKHVFLNILGGTLIAIMLGVYLSNYSASNRLHADGPVRPASAQVPDAAQRFPWQIQTLETGLTRVFGVTLGQTTLGQAEQLFKEHAALTLFAAPQTAPVIEAFFPLLLIASLKAKMVVSLDISTAEIKTMFERGARIETLSNGTRKVTLSDADALHVRESTIVGLTYLPWINLDAQQIENRFGLPAEKLNDPDSEGVHWLYPEKGVDIVLSETEKEVIQYVRPHHFKAHVMPLKTMMMKSANKDESMMKK